MAWRAGGRCSFVCQPLRLSSRLAQGLEKLHVEALAYDFPLGYGKAYANRLMKLGLCNDVCLSCNFVQAPALDGAEHTLTLKLRISFLASFLAVACPRFVGRA